MWSRKEGKEGEMPESCRSFLHMVAGRRSLGRKEVITGMEVKDVMEEAKDVIGKEVTDVVEEAKDVVENCLEQQSESECCQIVNF